MKKIMMFLIIGLAGGVSAQSGYTDLTKYTASISGTQLVAKATAQTYTIPSSKYCYSVSLHNTGTNSVAWSLATSTNGFNPKTASTLEANAAYATDGNLSRTIGRPITAITYQSNGGTNIVINVTFE